MRSLGLTNCVLLLSVTTSVAQSGRILGRVVDERVERRCDNSTEAQAVSDRVATGRTIDPALARLLQWLEFVPHHIPGCADAAATEVGGWLRKDLARLLHDLRVLSQAFHDARELKDRDLNEWTRRRRIATGSGAAPPVTIDLYRQRFTLDPDEEIGLAWPKGNYTTVFHGNDTLRSGALLHSDIAALVPDDRSALRVLVHDGRHTSSVRGSVHWDVARRLLDLITPGPGEDAGSLLWYRAVSAHLIGRALLDEAPAHLDRARQIFPDRAVFLIDSAFLHQKLASPAVQAAVEDLRANNRSVRVDSRDAELQRAERFLRQALLLEPDDTNARLRLGHTVGELGRHQAAVSELRKVIEAKPDGPYLYLAELFLGREHQSLGRRREAIQHFENAAALYPNAQSPRFAIGLVARQSGDRRTALSAVEHVAALASSGAYADDPWWFYYEPHLVDAEPWIDQMRRELAGAQRR